jgi:hypothetical protein
MNYPKYQVNITYYPSRVSGQQLIFLNGATQSVPAYQEGYYWAAMPELKIAASGSNYTSALDNLLAIATASTTTDPGNEPYSNIRTW